MDLRIHQFHVLKAPEYAASGLLLGYIILQFPDELVQKGELELDPLHLPYSFAGEATHRITFEIFRYTDATSPVLEPMHEGTTLSEELYRQVRTLVQAEEGLSSLFPKRKVLEQRGAA